jgi:hypothetical protein
VSAEILVPAAGDATVRWEPGEGELAVRLPHRRTACLIALGHDPIGDVPVQAAQLPAAAQ